MVFVCNAINNKQAKTCGCQECAETGAKVNHKVVPKYLNLFPTITFSDSHFAAFK